MRHLLPALLVGLLVAVAAPPAVAASRDQIIEDCADDGRLGGGYSADELRDARRNLPSDIDEYTDCSDVLRRAELAGRTDSGGSGRGSGGGTTGSGGSGGSGGATPGGTRSAERGGDPLGAIGPDEERELNRLREDAGPPVSVSGTRVDVGGADHDLPGPLLAALIVLALGAAAAAVPLVRRRVVGRRTS